MSKFHRNFLVAFGAILIAMVGFVVFTKLQQAPDDEYRSSTIGQRFLVPSGLSESDPAAQYAYIDWDGDRFLCGLKPISVPELLEKQSIWASRCKTPDIFEVLSTSPGLEILNVQMESSDLVCDLTSVNHVPKLRTLWLMAGGDVHLKNCHAIAQCSHLECLVFEGRMRISEDDISEIAASSTISFLHFGAGCVFAPGALRKLKTLKTLMEICIEWPKPALLEELSEISSLRAIYFGFDTDPSITTLSPFRKLPHLKTVRLCVEEGARRDSIRGTLPGVKLVLYSDPR
jgi:hypothetical protein